MYLLRYFLKLVHETLYKNKTKQQTTTTKKNNQKTPVLFHCIFPIFAFKIS